ncbi:MAG TPA: GNAT family N-acetyltransferase [Actinomycetota bacterium]|nr:GNAT family N-acetyltransferase [Actinomycetota bacterium]
MDEVERRHLERTLAGAEAALVRFGTVTQHKSRWRIAATLCTKGVTLVQLGRYEEGLAVCSEVLARYGTADEAPTRALLAGALRYRRAALAGLGRTEDEVAACDETVARFGEATDPILRDQAAAALVDKGDLLAAAGQEAGAATAWRQALQRYRSAGDATPELGPALEHARRRLAALPVDLRPCRPDDEEAAAALIIRAFEEFRPEISQQFWERFVAGAHQQATRPRGTELVVAEQAGTLLGAVTYCPAGGRYGGASWPAVWSAIRLLGVDPSARGLGVGRLLAAWCVARARELGDEAIGLHTSGFMIPARRIYEALGFERWPDLDVTPEGAPPALAYRLLLA